MKLIFTAALLMLIPSALLADESSDAKVAHCKYVTEHAKSQRDVLRAPNAVLSFVQPSAGTPARTSLGVQSSLANQRRAKLTMDAAATSCALYDVATDAQQHLLYALPTLENAILLHRRDLIEQTSGKLEALLTGKLKLVEAENLTRPQIYGLRAAKLHLDMNLTATLREIASSYVPELSDTPLRVLLGQELTAAIKNQNTANRLEKQNSWDIILEGGVHHTLTGVPVGQRLGRIYTADGFYGQAKITYNLGSVFEEKHLDESLEAYSDWKKNQVDDVVQQAALLEKQIRDTTRIQQTQLDTLLQHDAELHKEIDSLEGIDTSTALAYKTQLVADEIVLQVDIRDVQFSLEKYSQYLKDNFDEEMQVSLPAAGDGL